jgi:hypothetical protein
MVGISAFSSSAFVSRFMNSTTSLRSSEDQQIASILTQSGPRETPAQKARKKLRQKIGPPSNAALEGRISRIGKAMSEIRKVIGHVDRSRETAKTVATAIDTFRKALTDAQEAAKQQPKQGALTPAQMVDNAWITARSSIENAVSLTASAGAILVTGTAMTLADRNGNKGVERVRGIDISLSGLGLQPMTGLVAAGRFEDAARLADSAAIAISRAERQFGNDSARLSFEERAAGLQEKRLKLDRRAEITETNVPRKARRTGNALAALQMAIAGNATPRLRQF